MRITGWLKVCLCRRSLASPDTRNGAWVHTGQRHVLGASGPVARHTSVQQMPQLSRPASVVVSGLRVTTLDHAGTASSQACTLQPSPHPQLSGGYILLQQQELLAGRRVVAMAHCPVPGSTLLVAAYAPVAMPAAELLQVGPARVAMMPQACTCFSYHLCSSMLLEPAQGGHLVR
jgi:hypothetical protein